MRKLPAKVVDGVEEFVVTNVVVGRFSRGESDRAGGFEVGAVHVGEGRDSLLVGSGDELGAGHQLAVEMFLLDVAATNQAVARAFDDFVERFVAVHEANEEVIDEKKGGGADDPAGKAVVVADDGVLNCVGNGEKDNKVEGVELGEFAFAGQAQADEEKDIDQNGAEDFFEEWNLKIEHVLPGDGHGRPFRW